MTKQQMLFGAIIFIFTNTTTPILSPSIDRTILVSYQKDKDFVFDSGIRTEINGNPLFLYLYYERLQREVSPVFQYIKIIEFIKDKNFKELSTLGQLEREESYAFKGPDRQIFKEYAAINAALYCHDTEQVLDFEDNLHNIGAIIYGTRKLEHCNLYREYLKEQKLNEEETFTEKSS